MYFVMYLKTTTNKQSAYKSINTESLDCMAFILQVEQLPFVQNPTLLVWFYEVHKNLLGSSSMHGHQAVWV